MTRFRLTADELRAWREDGFFVRERQCLRGGARAAARSAAERVAALVTKQARAGESTSTSIDGNHYCELPGATLQYEHAPESQTVARDRALPPPRSALRSAARRSALRRARARAGRVAGGLAVHGQAESEAAARGLALPVAPGLAVLGPRDRARRASPERDARARRRGTSRTAACGSCAAAIGGACFRAATGEGRARSAVHRSAPASTRRRRSPRSCRPGASLFFHPHTVHGSEPNASARPRRALLFTYQPAGHRMFRVERERAIGSRDQLPVGRNPRASARTRSRRGSGHRRGCRPRRHQRRLADGRAAFLDDLEEMLVRQRDSCSRRRSASRAADSALAESGPSP